MMFMGDVISNLELIAKNPKMNLRFQFQFLLLVIALIINIPTSILASSSSSNQFENDGTVLELDDSNFDSAIATFDFILVDFYAPWCGHCKRLSPQLDAAAPVLARLDKPIVVAKVNADKFTRLTSKYEIDGFPTLKIFMHGVPVEYTGPRKAELLVRFLKKFVAADVSVLESDNAISNFVETAGTYFPIFIGFGLNESLISELAIKYKRKAWFSIAKDFSEDVMVTYDFDKVPALVSLHPTYNEKSVFYGPFEDNFLEDFIKQNLLPLSMPLTYDTLKLLNDDERKVVVTIVEDESDEKSLTLIKLLRAAASANRDLVFGYVGMKQWEDFAETFEVDKNTKLPKMVVWDRNEAYLSVFSFAVTQKKSGIQDANYSSSFRAAYVEVIGSESLEEDDQGSQITRFLEGYREGKTVQKRMSSPSIFGYLNSLIGIRTVYLIVFVIAVIMLIQTINKQDPDEAPHRKQTQTQVDDVSSSAAESETRPVYRPQDKLD